MSKPRSTLTAALALACLLAACASAQQVTPTQPDSPSTPAPEPTTSAEPTPAPTPEPTAEPTLEPTPEPTLQMDAVGLALVAEGFVAPVALVPAPDDSGRLFVVDQIGLVRVVTADTTLLPEPFLDVRDRMITLRAGYDERGLLGLAFHPDYAENGRLFVYYSAPLRTQAPAGWDHTGHLSEFSVFGDDPNRANPASERLLLAVDRPAECEAALHCLQAVPAQLRI